MGNTKKVTSLSNVQMEIGNFSQIFFFEKLIIKQKNKNKIDKKKKKIQK